MHGGRVNSGCGHIDILGESLVSTCLVAAPPRCATGGIDALWRTGTRERRFADSQVGLYRTLATVQVPDARGEGQIGRLVIGAYAHFV